jgi:alpha-1,3-rhamnosyl/mannosyltransferase
VAGGIDLVLPTSRGQIARINAPQGELSGTGRQGMTGTRVVFDARYINDRYHGIGRYAFRLLEAIVEIASDYTFIVFTGRGTESRFDLQSLAERRNISFQSGPWPLYWPHEQLIWPWQLSRARADLYHSPYFVTPVMSRVPAICTVHDLIFDKYPSYMPHAWSHPYYRTLMRLSIRGAARVLAVSESTKTDLMEHYGLAPGRIEVVSEGAEPAFRPIQNHRKLAELRSRYDLRRPFILNVGARRPHKNLVRLVEAFAILAPKVPHQLIFVGPKDRRFPDPLDSAVTDAGLNDRVQVLNWVPEEDLAGLYTLADVVALPSLIEGFGLPALEAMACGTPVVAANSSAFPEVVGPAGVLVDPHKAQDLAEAMGQLLDNPEQRRWLGAAGQARAAAFSWTRSAEQVLTIYRQVLQ